MKFYLCHTPEGRKRLLTRQDEAKKLDPTAEQIEIPVDQAGLKQAFEELFDQIYTLENQCPDEAAFDEGVNRTVMGKDADWIKDTKSRDTSPLVTQQAVEEWILNEASVSQVEAMFSRMGTRFAELKNQLKGQP